MWRWIILTSNLLKEYIDQILTESANKYEVLVFSSGKELLANYHENIDIFLLDIQMYKLNRMETAKKLTRQVTSFLPKSPWIRN